MNFDSEEYQSLVPNLSPLANYQSNLNYASKQTPFPAPLSDLNPKRR